MGHRLIGHPGKCKHYHGHNYAITFVIEGPTKVASGMVLDYPLAKEIASEALKPYDHAMCAQHGDGFLHETKAVHIPHPPTAEILCELWLQEFNKTLTKRI